MAYYDKLASAVINDVYSGLKGLHHNISISIEQVQDELKAERLLLIKEYKLKNALPLEELILSINCIDVDCKDLERCRCRESLGGTLTSHFEIPLLILDFNGLGIIYMGTTDRTENFTVYTSLVQALKHKYRKRRKDKPYVYIDPAPNENNMHDCFIFNAPFIRQVSVTGVFKDLELVEMLGCCGDLSDHFTWLDAEILKRVTEKKIRYYRLLSPPNLPNDQAYRL